MSFAVEMKNITKRFPGLVANDNVNFAVEHGEIHCLLGENGAGKTTLMKILFGLYKAEEGSININGEPAFINNPKVAFKLGLGMVHQHFMLINNLSALENIILGQEHGSFKMDMKKSYKIVKELADKYGIAINLNAKIHELSIGEKQRVEILKAIYRQANIIILDEPTAVLTPQEAEELMNIMRDMKAQGKTIIFITHKLNETMNIADRITVLRNGRNVQTINKKDTSPEQLARLMVGRDVNFNIEKAKAHRGDKVLEIRDIKLLPNAENRINFDLYEGEILGIAGVEGNGQRELEEIIMGLQKAQEGIFSLKEENIMFCSTKDRKAKGIGYIPSDRQKRGIIENFSIIENFLMGYQNCKEFSNNGLIKKQELVNHSEDMIKCFNIKVSGINQNIGSLSGGNQQKVVISREVSQNPCLVIAAQPTRGLDIGAIEYIHNQLVRLRDEGKAILLISAELSEILELSDRVGVLYKGEMMDLKETECYVEGEIGLLMAGRKLGCN